MTYGRNNLVNVFNHTTAKNECGLRARKCTPLE